MDFDKIEEAYNETLVGKEFVYLSKYGSTTFGRVKNVKVIYSSARDPETYREFRLEFYKLSPKVKFTEEDLKPIPVERKWLGYAPKITIISENGVPYDLDKDEIYFINE